MRLEEIKSIIKESKAKGLTWGGYPGYNLKIKKSELDFINISYKFMPELIELALHCKHLISDVESSTITGQGAELITEELQYHIKKT